jgi:hypothetical protein
LVRYIIIIKKDLAGYEDPTKQRYLNLIKTANDAIMQLVLYDTVYRGIFELFNINLVNNLIEKFKDDKEHILYNKQQLNDVDFFMAIERNNGNYLILKEDENSIIIVPKGQALRLEKQQLKKIYDTLKEKENIDNTIIASSNRPINFVFIIFLQA